MKAPAVGTKSPAAVAPTRARSAAPTGAGPVGLHAESMDLSVPTLLRMQAGIGNAAVAQLIARHPRLTAQRLADPTAPPVPPSRTMPHEDAMFVAVHTKVKSAGASMKKHPPAKAEAKKARDAAEPPANDAEAQAKAAKVGDMGAAKAGAFDKEKFVAAVRKAIDANSPKTLEEADNHAKSGKGDEVKNHVMGEVIKGKDGTTSDIKNATAAAPDPSKAQVKRVTPMTAPGAVPAPQVPAAAGMPRPVPAEQLNLQGGKHETDATLATAGVTEQTLATSNEPQFQQALDAKKAGEAHANAAPNDVRAMEKGALDGAKAGAVGSAAGALASMVASKAGGSSHVNAQQAAAKAKEEAERKNVATQIETIFQSTKTDTENILKGIDAQVDTAFTTGEAAAKAAFEASHTSQMDAWKSKRYMGGLNYGQWIADKVMGLPPEVQTFFTKAKELYIQKMEVVISNVADLIGRELTKAKDRIAKGRADVSAFVKSQPANLQKFATETEAGIAGKFEELDQSVDDKQEGLVEDLASKYTEARGAIDERVKALQDESGGLWDAAKAAVGETVDTVLKLKDMLLGIFARVASAVDRIIQDPIGFLGKFVNAVKAGLDKFVGNIGTHLKKGLQGWLFGALGDAGIEIPETFDLKGVLKLVLSVVGATWAALRAMIVARIGEPVMARIEQTVGFVKKLVTEGPISLWKSFVAKMGDIKTMVMEQVKSFLITKVITAGIVWLISMLNPAGAFAKACKMIVDVVNFFVEKGEAIKGVVDSAVESVEEILGGGVSKVASMIEDALAKVVPVLIGLLASLLGLGGISEKIKSILEKLRKPVNKAMDFVVGKVVKLGKGLLRKLKNSKLGKMAAKAKAKVKAGIAKGKAYVKKKIKGAKKWVKKKISGKASPAKAAEAVLGAAKGSMHGGNAKATLEGVAARAGAQFLEGAGSILISAGKKVQRTTVTAEVPQPVPQAEERKPRSSEPLQPDQAGQILTLIKQQMPTLLAAFEQQPVHTAMVAARAKFLDMMKPHAAARVLTPAVRQVFEQELAAARVFSRTKYYASFRDLAWKSLRPDKLAAQVPGSPPVHGPKSPREELAATMAAHPNGAQWGAGSDTAISILVEVRAADGTKTTRMRSIDFEHVTRVTDNPFTLHSSDGGKNANLAPMEADINRYYQEALRDDLKMADWNASENRAGSADEISKFIQKHQLYQGHSAPGDPGATPEKVEPQEVDWDKTFNAGRQ